GLERRQRLLEFIVLVVILADDKQRLAALGRVVRLAVGVVGARHHVVVVGVGKLRLRQFQPGRAIVGAKRDRLFQIVDRLPVALGSELFVGVLLEARDQVGLAFFGVDAIEQVLAIVTAGIGQFL